MDGIDRNKRNEKSSLATPRELNLISVCSEVSGRDDGAPLQEKSDVHKHPEKIGSIQRDGLPVLNLVAQVDEKGRLTSSNPNMKDHSMRSNDERKDNQPLSKDTAVVKEKVTAALGLQSLSDLAGKEAMQKLGRSHVVKGENGDEMKILSTASNEGLVVLRNGNIYMFEVKPPNASMTFSPGKDNEFAIEGLGMHKQQLNNLVEASCEALQKEGAHQLKRGQKDGAESTFQTALQVTEIASRNRVLESKDQVPYVLSTISWHYGQAEEFAKAAEYRERSLKEYEHSANHGDVFFTRLALSSLYRKLGDTDKAAKHVTQVEKDLVNYEALYGKNNRLAKEERTRLFHEEIKLDRFSQAAEILQRSFDNFSLQESRQGKNSPSLFNDRNDLAVLYAALSEKDPVNKEALSEKCSNLLRDSKKILFDSVSNSNQITREHLDMRDKLAKACQKAPGSEPYSDAKQLEMPFLERELAKLRKELGSDRDEVINIKRELGSVYCKEGQVNKGLDLLLDALAATQSKNRNGDISEASQPIVQEIAEAYTCAGKYPQAEHVLNKQIEAVKARPGASDQDMMPLLESLAMVYRGSGNLAGEHSALKQLHDLYNKHDLSKRVVVEAELISLEEKIEEDKKRRAKQNNESGFF
jgi:tetratricopeptide (TPR) repeat protein